MAGRHAEALRGYLWFHRNALKYRQSLYGVRLSFALSYWMELGKVYPEALRALKRVRNQKSSALRSGRGDRDTFHDVASINHYLGKESDTCRLFKKLHLTRPRLAAACAQLAIPALVHSRDFKLARTYVPDPESLLSRNAEMFADGVRRAAGKPRALRAASREAHLRIYCKDVELLTSILRGVGERRKAAEIRARALTLVEPAGLRRAVASRLSR